MLEGIAVSYDCTGIELLPNVVFTIDGIDYELTPLDYVLKIQAFGLTECALGLVPMDLPKGFNYFILGDIFMRRYYSYFDKNRDRVGFYDMKLFD